MSKARTDNGNDNISIGLISKSLEKSIVYCIVIFLSMLCGYFYALSNFGFSLPTRGLFVGGLNIENEEIIVCAVFAFLMGFPYYFLYALKNESSTDNTNGIKSYLGSIILLYYIAMIMIFYLAIRPYENSAVKKIIVLASCCLILFSYVIFRIVYHILYFLKKRTLRLNYLLTISLLLALIILLRFFVVRFDKDIRVPSSDVIENLVYAKDVVLVLIYMFIFFINSLSLIQIKTHSPLGIEQARFKIWMPVSLTIILPMFTGYVYTGIVTGNLSYKILWLFLLIALAISIILLSPLRNLISSNCLLGASIVLNIIFAVCFIQMQSSDVLLAWLTFLSVTLFTTAIKHWNDITRYMRDNFEELKVPKSESLDTHIHFLKICYRYVFLLMISSISIIFIVSQNPLFGFWQLALLLALCATLLWRAKRKLFSEEFSQFTLNSFDKLRNEGLLYYFLIVVILFIPFIPGFSFLREPLQFPDPNDAVLSTIFGIVASLIVIAILFFVLCLILRTIYNQNSVSVQPNQSNDVDIAASLLEGKVPMDTKSIKLLLYYFLDYYEKTKELGCKHTLRHIFFYPIYALILIILLLGFNLYFLKTSSITIFLWFVCSIIIFILHIAFLYKKVLTDAVKIEIIGCQNCVDTQSENNLKMTDLLKTIKVNSDHILQLLHDMEPFCHMSHYQKTKGSVCLNSLKKNRVLYVLYDKASAEDTVRLESLPEGTEHNDTYMEYFDKYSVEKHLLEEINTSMSLINKGLNRTADADVELLANLKTDLIEQVNAEYGWIVDESFSVVREMDFEP